MYQLSTRVRRCGMQRNELSTEEVVTSGDAARYGDGEQSSVFNQGVDGPDTTAQASLVDLEPAASYVSGKETL